MGRVSLAIALSALLLLSGCKGRGSGQPSSTGSAIAKATSAAGSLMNGKEELMRAAEAMKNAKSWREHMVMDEAGKSVQVEVEVSCPDKEHTTSTMNGRTFESIHLGNDSYTKIGGQWMRMPATRTALANCGMGTLRPARDQMDPMAELDKAKITPAGLDTVNGSPCQEYQIEPTAGAEPGSKDVTSTVCIGVTDHLPRQMKAEGMTVTWSDWNQPVSIAAPM